MTGGAKGDGSCTTTEVATDAVAGRGDWECVAPFGFEDADAEGWRAGGCTALFVASARWAGDASPLGVTARRGDGERSGTAPTRVCVPLVTMERELGRLVVTYMTSKGRVKTDGWRGSEAEEVGVGECILGVVDGVGCVGCGVLRTTSPAGSSSAAGSG